MDQQSILETCTRLAMFFVPFLFALCFHEYAHGWVARLKGDRTAEMMGRLTLNPLVHMDPIGTVVMPILSIVFGFPFFGWAKPVPVNTRNLRRPKQDMFWVALAGPLSNILLALVSGLILWPAIVVGLEGRSVGTALLNMTDIFITVNLFLAIFNLIPLHPLDGGKIVEPFLPARWTDWLEENQSTLSWVLMFAFMLGGFRILVPPVYWAKESIIGLGTHLAQLV